jgi:2-oxoglutarate dehydrogenase E1 component
MQDEMMESWLNSSHFQGGDDYIESLYELYLQDANSVSPEWQQLFSALPSTSQSSEVNHTQLRAELKQSAKQRQPNVSSGGDAGASAINLGQISVLQLIDAYRLQGHLHATLDPLKLWQRPRIEQLDPSFYGLKATDMDTSFHIGNFGNPQPMMKLADLIQALEATYCGDIGVEYMHITNGEERRWIQKRVESQRSQDRFSKEERQRLYQGLSAAEGLEKYLGVKFPGTKRFSLEGGDALIPMLKEIIYRGSHSGVKEVVIGMPHRGRLNVLINVLGKQSKDLFDEFAGKHSENYGSGDVKYHLGYSSDFNTSDGDVHLTLAFNPSHLEIVNPVVMGSVRSRQDRRQCEQGLQVLPITIHGDSAIAGQGVVQETFNMSQTRAFKVGGSIRIVVNNQVGFTTSNPEDIRSTVYCTDIAKMVQAPIFHVNADDPEAVAFVTHLAVDYRNTFHRDVLIDLVCYRRHGHNEADEPNATQPLMYQLIKKHPTPRKIYADQLVASGVMAAAELKAIDDAYRDLLEQGQRTVAEWRAVKEQNSVWTPFVDHSWQDQYDNSLPTEMIKNLAQKITQVPGDFKLHSRVQKVYQDREKMAAGEKLVDWGFAENMAYAGLLAEGHRVRLVGQDSGRGTFFHRHAILHEQNTAKTHMPLRYIADNQGPIEVYDSVLSEASVLAFEYGYATAEPRGLTIWEAQFGDFVNCAQVVIDQFLSSGEQKWGRLCGLTLLLPHGYEGQGPEHSSARLERFLQLCADYNMQVCIPSTPAQVYHMLRRQVVRPLRRPLVVMSPKSLLRHALATSTLEELAQGQFHNVIDEIDALSIPQIKRLIFCSGKVYYELLEMRREHKIEDIALVRMEQLYPFPHEEVEAIFAKYKHVKEFVWCQEEPKNQGAWYSSHHHFLELIPNAATFFYVGRSASASPAVGSPALHAKQQKELIMKALGLKL